MQVSLLEAAANLNKLVEAAINGEEVILLNSSDRPVAQITSVKNGSTKAKNFDQPTEEQPRVLGLYQNRGWIGEDFNAPLPDSFWTGEIINRYPCLNLGNP
jgi:antitoxin (DNA-binding transcriptional repressor) of toxin-antitoxin stability system